MKIFYLIFMCLMNIFIQAQNFPKDSLNKLSDKELLKLFNNTSADSLSAENIIRVYLNRAQKEKDTIKIARAYGRFTSISKTLKKLSFCDSIINLTKNINNKNYPAIGYILKAEAYNKSGDLKLVSKNYFEAYKLALKRENITQQIFISDRLIILKAYWGNKREALDLQKKRHQLVTKKEYIEEIKESAIERGSTSFEDLYFESELTSLQNFVVCYINLKILDSASIYLEKGFQKIEKYQGYNKKYFHNWFKAGSVEIDWYAKNYKKVIETSNELLAVKDKENNIGMLIDIYYFKGFSLIKSGKYNRGIRYLKKVDSIFEHEKNSILPYHRSVFEELLTYYSYMKNSKMKTRYLNKLQVVDSIFKKNYQFFEPNLIRNYERPQLIEEKEALITDLKQKNKKSSVKTWWMLLILIISLIVFGFYFKRQQLYKKRFEKLIQQQELSNIENIEKPIKQEDIDATLHKNKISSEVVSDILNHLQNFETNKEFISQEVSLQNMAKSFGTNNNYLSKVINLKKDKNFSTYISDLRIVYSFQKLKTDPKLRKYTIKAIANDCGYSSAEHYSKKFYKKYGIYPSYYIKKLEQQN